LLKFWITLNIAFGILQGISVACAGSEIGLHFSHYCISDDFEDRIKDTVNSTSVIKLCPNTTPIGIGFWPAPLIILSMILIKSGSSDKICPFIGLISVVSFKIRIIRIFCIILLFRVCLIL